MLRLKESEVCPYGRSCQYNSGDTCLGARSGRDTAFDCEFVKGGVIQDGGIVRNPHDKTGKMKVILE